MPLPEALEVGRAVAVAPLSGMAEIGTVPIRLRDLPPLLEKIWTASVAESDQHCDWIE